MSTNVGSIHYDLKLDTSGFDRAAAQIGDTIGKVGKKMQSMGKTMTTRVSLPLAAGFGFAIKAASDLEETINKVNVSFGDSAKSVHEWSKTSIKSMGLARQSALDATALFGDMATSMGVSEEAAAKMSMELVQLGGDLASFKNIGFEQAKTALAGIFTGETESLKRLGIVMTEANLEAFALSRGINENVSEMTQAEKVNLRLAYVMSVTKNTQGDFARTSESTANQMRITRERTKELSAEVGGKLTPIFGELLKKINGVLDAFNRLSPQQQDTILKAALVAAALGPVVFIMGSLVTAVKAVVFFLTILAAHPIILAIMLLIAAIAALWIWWDKIPGVVKLALAAIAPFIVLPMAIIKHWDQIVGFFSRLWSGIKSGASNAFGTLIDWTTNLPARIKNAVGNLWGILFDAGWHAINSLWAGMKAQWDKVASWLGGVANKIKELKGPLSKDRVMLIKEGQAVMQGFHKGLIAGFGPVKNTLMDITRNIAGIDMAGQTNINNSTAINGSINIGSRQDADYLLHKLNRNLALEEMGVSPA